MTSAFNELDLIELSDLAWEIVDPGGDHETEEVAWTAALRDDWPPIATVGQLRMRLSEVAEAIRPAAPSVPLVAVAALVAFLAQHPERRAADEEAMLKEALQASYPQGPPEEISAWLSQRGHAPAVRRRAHGARQPRRRASGSSVRAEDRRIF